MVWPSTLSCEYPWRLSGIPPSFRLLPGASSARSIQFRPLSGSSCICRGSTFPLRVDVVVSMSGASPVTATPGSTPPVESVTVPLTVASCAYAGTASASIPTITISRLTTRQRNKVNMRASSRKEQEGERRRRSEIAWHNCAIAVPILDDPIPVLQEPEKTAVRTVPEAMAPYFDAVARLEIAGGDANSLERRPPGGFERPQLRLAFGILDFQVHPGMRDNVVHFPDDTFDVDERVGVGAVRMVGPCGKRDAKRTHRCGNQCEPHVQPPHRARKGFVRSAALIRLARRRARGVNPTLTGLNRPVHARRCRHSIDEDRLVDVDELIAQPDPVLVEPSERLLKQARLRVPRRHGCLGDIELVPVHVDPCERTGLVGVVGELQLMAFDHVDVVPDVRRQLRVPLHELPRRVDDRAPHIVLPVPGVAWASQARFGARRALLGFFGE